MFMLAKRTAHIASHNPRAKSFSLAENDTLLQNRGKGTRHMSRFVAGVVHTSCANSAALASNICNDLSSMRDRAEACRQGGRIVFSMSWQTGAADPAGYSTSWRQPS